SRPPVSNSTLAGALRDFVDLVDELWPELLWDVVAHSLVDPQLGIGDRPGRRSAAAGKDQLVGGTVKDDCRHVELREGPVSLRLAVDRVKLPSRSFEVDSSLVGHSADLPQALLVGGKVG